MQTLGSERFVFPESIPAAQPEAKPPTAERSSRPAPRPGQGNGKEPAATDEDLEKGARGSHRQAGNLRSRHQREAKGRERDERGRTWARRGSGLRGGGKRSTHSTASQPRSPKPPETEQTPNKPRSLANGPTCTPRASYGKASLRGPGTSPAPPAQAHPGLKSNGSSEHLNQPIPKNCGSLFTVESHPSVPPPTPLPNRTCLTPADA